MVLAKQANAARKSRHRVISKIEQQQALVELKKLELNKQERLNINRGYQM